MDCEKKIFKTIALVVWLCFCALLGHLPTKTIVKLKKRGTMKTSVAFDQGAVRKIF